MIHFSIARYESDCHGGGYYEDLAPDDEIFENLHTRAIAPLLDLDMSYTCFGERVYYEIVYKPVIPDEILESERYKIPPEIRIKTPLLERDTEKVATPDYMKEKNPTLHYLGYDKRKSFSAILTWDIERRLWICDENVWQKLYRRCAEYGIHREWEMKTFYDGIPYKRVVLDYKGDCD